MVITNKEGIIMIKKNKLPLFVFLSFGVLLISCSLFIESEPKKELFIVKIDSLYTSDIISNNDTLIIKLWGFIGTNGCYSLSHYKTEKTDDQFDLTVWSKYTPAKICPDVIVELRGEEYKILPPYRDPFTVVIHQPDGYTLSRYIIVQ